MAVSKAAQLILDLKGNLKRESEATAGSVGKLDGAIGAVKVGVGAMASAAVAATGALIGLRSEVAGAVDQMNTLAQASGLSIETINGMRHAAESTGKKLEDLVPLKLAKNMLAVDQGSKQMADAFRQAGARFDESGKLMGSADEVYRDMLDTLGKMENRTLAAGLAATTMGAQGRQMLSAFSNRESLDGFVAVASEFGFKVGPEAVRQTGEWQAATGRLALAMDDAKQSIMDAIGGDGLNKAVEIAAESVIFLGTLTSTILDQQLTSWGAFFSALEALYAGDQAAFEANIMKARMGNIEDIQTAIDDAWARTNEFAASGGSQPAFYGPEMPTPGDGGGGGPGGKPPGKGSDPVEKLAEIELNGQAMMDAHFQGLADAAAAQMDQQAQLIAIANAANGADLAGMVGKIPVLGSLATGVADLLTHGDDMARQALRGMEAMPDMIGESVETLLTKVLPRFLSRLPEFLFDLLIKMPITIWKGIVMAVPKMIEGFVKGIGDAFKTAIREILDFFRGGKDRNILTGKDGRIFGWKPGESSMSSVMRFDEPPGSKRRKNAREAAEGAFATGTKSVPQDGMYWLHKDEEVKTTHRAGGGGGITIGTVNVHGVRNLGDLVREIQAYTTTYGGHGTLGAV